MTAFQKFDPAAFLAETASTPAKPAKPAKVDAETASEAPAFATCATFAGGGPENSNLPIIADYEERAAIVQFEGAFPQAWAEGLARLDTMPAPKDIPVTRWRTLVSDAARLVDQWGAKLFALNWRPEDIFGTHPAAPYARDENKGLVWFLGDGEVIALTEGTATIRFRDGAQQRFIVRRNISPETTVLWRLEQ